MVGRARENLPGGSIKHLLHCLNIRIFKCRYRTIRQVGLHFLCRFGAEQAVIPLFGGCRRYSCFLLDGLQRSLDRYIA